MSLSPLVSFKSRFVTYLLNFPRIKDVTFEVLKAIKLKTFF